MEFTLRFSGDSWAEVYDAKGAKLFYDVGSADSVKTMSGSPPLRVILGNPNGVAVEVNGKSATVPKMKGDNGVQFTVFRNGRLSRGRAAPSGQ
jgi:cytoskeleton protein RodZ